MNDYLFKTTAINKDGGKGIAYIKDGMIIPLDHFNQKERLGSNPEELFALAWATCLHSTLKLLLRAKNMTNESEVRVQVFLKLNRETKRYYFDVYGEIEIKGLELDEMEKIIAETDSRCPISQLIADKPTVHLKASKFTGE
ncbi:MAG: OsmC family protein [Acholeplasma sp.]|nr:OsmC family protein [Acholeplasma sp.]